MDPMLQLGSSENPETMKRCFNPAGNGHSLFLADLVENDVCLSAGYVDRGQNNNEPSRRAMRFENKSGRGRGVSEQSLSMRCPQRCQEPLLILRSLSKGGNTDQLYHSPYRNNPCMSSYKWSDRKAAKTLDELKGREEKEGIAEEVVPDDIALSSQLLQTITTRVNSR